VRFCPVPPTFRCTAHPDKLFPKPGMCPLCHEEMMQTLRGARWVLVNYDVLGAHKDVTDAGATYFRTDLPGWGPILAQLEFDTAFLDESHNLAGWESSTERKQKHRRELVCDVVDPIERVYAATGTPMRGFVRDLWGQLDCISRGLWS